MRTLRIDRNLTAFAAAGCLLTLSVAASEPAPEKSSQPSQPADTISAAQVRPHVEYLASPQLEGRGTLRGKKLAVEYIERHFRELSLQPLFGKDGFFQDVLGARDKNGRATVAGKNIGAWLPGSDPGRRDEFVIVSAHYDHLGIRNGNVYPGADDNAGSVAMLLEVARRFARMNPKPKRSIVFLSCDLEENMLWGSRWFVAHPPWPIEKVKLFVTSEMIGRTLGDLPMKTIFALGTEHAGGLKEIVNSAPLPDGLEIAHLGIDLIGTRSDYGPFRTESVPFVFFSGGEHADYHQPTDTADRLDYDRVAGVSQVILHVCRQVADADQTPEWSASPQRDLDEVRTLHRITELVLAADDQAGTTGKPRLGNVQRFTVSNVRTKAAQILERGTMTPDERAWLIRSSQFLLLTVF